MVVYLYFFTCYNGIPRFYSRSNAHYVTPIIVCLAINTCLLEIQGILIITVNNSIFNQ